MPTTAVDNSYLATIEEAEALKRSKSTVWDAAEDDDKAEALQEATRRIDALPLRGQRYELPYLENGVQKDTNGDGIAQVLEFPRVIDGVLCDWDHKATSPSGRVGMAVVPALVKLACLEEAIAIIEFDADTDRSERRIMKDDGVKSYSLGGDYSETLGPSTIDVQAGLQSKVAWRHMKRYVGLEVR